MKILLDNGHGWDTPGKRSPVWNDGTQLLEWAWNREIVSLIYVSLIQKGLEPVVLVPETKDILLSERVKRANEYYGKDKGCFGVSVHANAFQPNKASGFEIWTSIGQTDSDFLAECIFKEAEKNNHFLMRKDTTDNDSDKENNFTMVYGPKCPFVLTENGFMDNEKDCRYMLSDEGRKDIVKIHVDGIINYINSKQL